MYTEYPDPVGVSSSRRTPYMALGKVTRSGTLAEGAVMSFLKKNETK